MPDSSTGLQKIVCRARAKRPRAEEGEFPSFGRLERAGGAAGYQVRWPEIAISVKCHLEAPFALNPRWQAQITGRAQATAFYMAAGRYPLCGHGLTAEPDRETLAGVEGLESDRVEMPLFLCIYSGGGAPEPLKPVGRGDRAIWTSWSRPPVLVRRIDAGPPMPIGGH
ncbi:hypothetical protein BST67_08075 [Bradyrhizobium canariense]|nr:hypothetical protein BST67_08075 [Bradyrhizobium canariense]